jgi:hypothetical protein
MTSQNQQHTTALWLWPTGLFRRRVIYYLRAKSITSSILHKEKTKLVSVVLANGALASILSLEARPADTSLPVLRIIYAHVTTF